MVGVIGVVLWVAACHSGVESWIGETLGLEGWLAARVGFDPGTIDSDYRGEVKVIMANLGSEPFEVTRGMRIAQAVVAPVVQATIEVVESLDETERGAGGFGHTGT